MTNQMNPLALNNPFRNSDPSLIAMVKKSIDILREYHPETATPPSMPIYAQTLRTMHIIYESCLNFTMRRNDGYMGFQLQIIYKVFVHKDYRKDGLSLHALQELLVLWYYFLDARQYYADQERAKRQAELRAKLDAKRITVK